MSIKPRLKLCWNGLRIQCLFLLAEQVHGLRSGSPRLCPGTVYRAALYSDLCIGGSGNMDDLRDRLKKETYRRLWAAIVEMDLQASMDWGSPPIFFRSRTLNVLCHPIRKTQVWSSRIYLATLLVRNTLHCRNLRSRLSRSTWQKHSRLESESLASSTANAPIALLILR